MVVPILTSLFDPTLHVRNDVVLLMLLIFSGGIQLYPQRLIRALVEEVERL
jgi:hypothetical protein